MIERRPRSCRRLGGQSPHHSDRTARGGPDRVPAVSRRPVWARCREAMRCPEALHRPRDLPCHPDSPHRTFGEGHLPQLEILRGITSFIESCLCSESRLVLLRTEGRPLLRIGPTPLIQFILHNGRFDRISTWCNCQSQSRNRQSQNAANDGIWLNRRRRSPVTLQRIPDSPMTLAPQRGAP